MKTLSMNLPRYIPSYVNKNYEILNIKCISISISLQNNKKTIR